MVREGRLKGNELVNLVGCSSAPNDASNLEALRGIIDWSRVSLAHWRIERFPGQWPRPARGRSLLAISSVHFKLLPQLDPRHLVLLLQGTGNKVDIPIL
jgi:hypothetical protein